MEVQTRPRFKVEARRDGTSSPNVGCEPNIGIVARTLSNT